MALTERIYHWVVSRKRVKNQTAKVQIRLAFLTAKGWAFFNSTMRVQYHPFLKGADRGLFVEVD